MIRTILRPLNDANVLAILRPEVHDDTTAATEPSNAIDCNSRGLDLNFEYVYDDSIAPDDGVACRRMRYIATRLIYNRCVPVFGPTSLISLFVFISVFAA